MRQAHIFYSGTVQGVGFRFTVQKYAEDLSLVGWVRNLSDGRVEIKVEGSEDQIGELCQKIDSHFRGYIKNKEIDFREPLENFTTFQIAF